MLKRVPLGIFKIRWTHLTISINIMMPQKPDNNSNLSRAYCVPGTVLSTLLVLTHWILMVSCSRYCYYHHFRGEQTDTENTHLSCLGSGRAGIWAQQSSPKVWTPNCYAVLSISNFPYRMTQHNISFCGGMWRVSNMVSPPPLVSAHREVSCFCCVNFLLHQSLPLPMLSHCWLSQLPRITYAKHTLVSLSLEA